MGPNEAWIFIKQLLQQGMEESIPKVAISNSEECKPVWMNKKALKSIQKKYNLYKKYLRSKSSQDYIKYIKERNLYTKLLRTTCRDNEKNIVKESKSKSQSILEINLGKK